MDENQISQRRVILGSVTKQHSSGNIVFAVRMPLTGDSLASLPDWLSTGYAAVAQQFTEVEPEVQEISGIALSFHNEVPEPGELFKHPSARLPVASLRSFSIARAGEPDDPTIELQFKVYAAFSRAFWAWIGEMAGQEVSMAFPGGALAKASPSAEEPALDDQPTLEEATGEKEPKPEKQKKAKK